MSGNKTETGHKPSVWARNTGGGSPVTWLLQRLTGLFIIFMILLHFGINHFVSSGSVTYEAVSARLYSPLWKCFDMAFLSFALYHGLAGLWVVAADYVNNSGWRLFVFSVIVLGGAALFCLGAVTIIGFAPAPGGG